MTISFTEWFTFLAIEQREEVGRGIERADSPPFRLCRLRKYVFAGKGRAIFNSTSPVGSSVGSSGGGLWHTLFQGHGDAEAKAIQGA